MFSRETKNRRLKSEDVGLQRTDLIHCETSTLDNTACLHDQPVCFIYKSLVTTVSPKTMEVQIQFTSWPERVGLSNDEIQKQRQTCTCTHNKNKHHSSFTLCLSTQRVKNNLKANPLSFFSCPTRPHAILSLLLSSLPPSLFHPAKNHRTGKGGLSFSYLAEQRAHRVAKGCSFFSFSPVRFLPSSLPSFLHLCVSLPL